jgi:hypothetical protein
MKHRVRMSGRTGITGLAVVAAAVLTLTACGNPVATITTEHAVSDDFGGVMHQSGLNVTLSLGVTAQQLQQVAAGEGDLSRLTPQIASALVHTSLSVDFETGHGESITNKQTGTDGSDQFDLALQVRGGTPIELRYVGKTIYLKADVATLLADFGQPSSDAAKFQSELQSANSFVPGLTALGQGQWVSVPDSALAPYLKQLKSSVPAANSTAELKGLQNLVGQLRTALEQNTTYTNAGTHGGRTEYVVSLAAHSFVQQVQADLPAALSSIPGASGAARSVSNLASKIPAGQTVVLDLWVSHDKAQEIDIDLNQFAHKYSFAIPLRIVIGSGTSIATPHGATALNLSKVSSMLGGLLGGLGSNGSSASATAEPVGT